MKVPGKNVVLPLFVFLKILSHIISLSFFIYNEIKIYR